MRASHTNFLTPSLDANRYKDRNVVERFFPRVKKCRGLATRIDKHAINCRGAWFYLPCLTGLTPIKRHDITDTT
ncbi:TPA: transposase [Corynebacterium striatum]|nr:transposase [Corynebacterium striatum]HAT1267298.1 transposase [Corynebacterium striatum]HAT1312693.1 transposase [Corynebacterium striatum]HAT1317836.1 transposase [Corynebacterium striatum]HAT1335512.1 transposase [Corynebacterium striatum]